MVTGPEYEQEHSATRWVAYFDLLGTKALIESGKIRQVFAAYAKARAQLSRHPKVSYAWFSDSFLLYMPDDSGEAFTWIEQLCRWFAFNLIHGRIPVRGALSCGQLYADHQEGVYFGQGLVDAYSWGEAQDWLGFLLTPATVRRLNELSLPIAERWDYRQYLFPSRSRALCRKQTTRRA